MNFTNGGAVQLGDWNDNDFQKWNIRQGGDGTYMIDLTNKLGSYQADIEGISGNDGAGMHLWNNLNADNQKFYFTAVPCDNQTSCNVTINASTPKSNFSPGEAVQLSYTCSGTDCPGLNYVWSGNGANGGTSPYNIPAPAASGSYTYTITATKPGCSKVASTSINVVVGDASYSQCKEAESSTGNGAITADPNASNGHTRGDEGNYNHYVDYALTGVPSAGTYALTLRYYSSSAPAVGIQINGGVTQTQNLPNSGSWNIGWTEQTINVSLTAGNNTIRILGTGGGSCRQDRICVVGGGGGCTVPNAPTLSASPSTINAGSSSTLSASGCSGTVTWSHGLGTGSTRPVSQSSTTTYTAICTVNGCASSAGSTTVTVSGQSGSYNECREAELSAGNGAITGDPNASNGQTRGSEGDNNHYVDYMFNGVPTSGTYYMKVRYYSTGVATVGVQVNGGSTQTVNLANSGSWNIVWTEHSVPVNLISGNNTIRIMGIGGNSCRQDRVCISNNSNARMGISETFVTASPPGLQESDLNGLLITPNPNTGTFEVAFYLEEGKKATLSILDVKGISWSRQQISGKGNHREKVVLTENAIGTFIVLLRKDNGTETRRTIVIR